MKTTQFVAVMADTSQSGAGCSDHWRTGAVNAFRVPCLWAFDTSLWEIRAMALMLIVVPLLGFAAFKMLVASCY